MAQTLQKKLASDSSKKERLFWHNWSKEFSSYAVFYCAGYLLVQEIGVYIWKSIWKLVINLDTQRAICITYRTPQSTGELVSKQEYNHV